MLRSVESSGDCSLYSEQREAATLDNEGDGTVNVAVIAALKSTLDSLSSVLGSDLLAWRAASLSASVLYESAPMTFSTSLSYKDDVLNVGHANHTLLEKILQIKVTAVVMSGPHRSSRGKDQCPIGQR